MDITHSNPKIVTKKNKSSPSNFAIFETLPISNLILGPGFGLH